MLKASVGAANAINPDSELFDDNTTKYIKFIIIDDN